MARSTGVEPSLRVYETLARLPRLGYRGKILLVAFVGTHVPLLGLIGWFLVRRTPMDTALPVLGVVLAVTLAGTALTLFLLHQLLRPIGRTARALRRYVEEGELPALPTGHTDLVGRLMGDTDHVLRRLDRTIRSLGQHDEITGLPNRARFAAELAERASGNAPFAVCALRLNGLEPIVSAFGRRRADHVLRLAVRRLETSLRGDERLYRLDAKTLAVVLEMAEPDRIVECLADLDRRLEALGDEGFDLELSCRCGVSLGTLDDSDAEALLDNALVALEIAERQRRAVGFYSETSRRALLERYTLLGELRQALRGEGGLSLHFQPIVDAAREAIVGAEALLRWQHPRRGLLMPAQFVPLAEESGLIDEIGRWTLHAICEQLSAWRASALVVPRIAINLSARQFADPHLPKYLAETIAAHDIGADALELELTETTAMADTRRTRATMHALRALGVGLSIDDFGTAHASLSLLRSLPFSKLKIDREFVRDVHANAEHLAICRSLIALAAALGLELLAEGVESAQEVGALRRNGCEMFQGYHYYRPLPVAAFTALLVGPRIFDGREAAASS